MHQNYHFLRHLTEQLRTQLVGMELVSCFSQNKDELVLGFAEGERELYIRAMLTAHFSSLSFPTEFKRARANTINLFTELQGRVVQDVVQHLNERSFYLKLSQGYTLLFKLFGNRANIVLYHKGEPIKPFHKKFGADMELEPFSMDRSIRQNFEAFAAAEGGLRKVYPTFGDLPALYLEQQGYGTATLQEKWELVQAMLEIFDAPQAYYIIRLQGKLRLSLLEIGEVVQVYATPMEALNGFTRSYLSETGFERLHEQTLQQLQKKQRATQAILDHTEARLYELRHGRSYAQIADIIMANLSNIPPRTTDIELYDFYTDRMRKFKLKATETPQKQAERLYRKAKKQHVEISQLEEQQERKLEEAIVLEDALQALEEVKTYKALKLYLKEYAHLLTTRQQAQQEAPFRLFETEGFKILVGKSAQNNDLLTQRHTYKEDIWLHAKDVSGSHVVIKHQAGKAIPATVLGKAAQLAAYYSKRKSDSLCPVLYTPKKWVRKPKGAPAGAVVVEREQVILVKPENPFERRV